MSCWLRSRKKKEKESDCTCEKGYEVQIIKAIHRVKYI